MNVQTIPAIAEMTAVQRADLMEALWKEMTRKAENVESPEWHGRVLDERERALAAGEIGYMDWEEAKTEIRRKTVDRQK